MKAILVALAIIAAIYFGFFHETKAPVNSPSPTAVVATPIQVAPNTAAAETIAPVAATPASEEHWWTPTKAAVAGFLVGGWFIGTLSLTAEIFLFGLIGIPCILMAILVEWSDTRVAWPWGFEIDDRESHEIWTSILFFGMIGVLIWGGIPIWATFMEHPWIYSFAYFVPVGLCWGCYRWDSWSKHLHMKLAQYRKEILVRICKHLEELLDLRSERRKVLKLAATDPLPNYLDTWQDRPRPRLEHHNWAEAEATLQEDFLSREKEAERTAISDEELKQWISELKAATRNEEDADEKNLNLRQWLRQLSLGVPERKPIRFPKEFAAYFKDKDRNAPKVSAKDHKGQIYLWTVFWPLSMSFRFVRWVVTLKWLRDIFNFIWNRLRFVYDRIAERHEVKFETIERAPVKTPPSDGADESGEPTRSEHVAPNFGPAKRAAEARSNSIKKV